MSYRLCDKCGFVMQRGHRDVCIAEQEAKSRPGYQPGFRPERKPQPDMQRFGQGHFQCSPRRG